MSDEAFRDLFTLPNILTGLASFVVAMLLVRWIDKRSRPS